MKINFECIKKKSNSEPKKILKSISYTKYTEFVGFNRYFIWKINSEYNKIVIKSEAKVKRHKLNAIFSMSLKFSSTQGWCERSAQNILKTDNKKFNYIRTEIKSLSVCE